MLVLKGLASFVSEHFDKLLIAGLLVFFAVRGDAMTTKEMVAALLVLVRGLATTKETKEKE